MRTVKLVLLAGMFFFSIALAQPDNIVVLEKLYRENHLAELETQLRTLDAKDQDYPSVLFFRGVFESDADKALIYYNKVRSEYKDNPFAADALLRIAQYYYAREDYKDARIYLSTILTRYPDSEIKDQAQYFLCQSIYAQGKQDSARIFLQAFIENVRNSPYVDMAVTDLESPVLWQRQEKETPRGRVSGTAEKELYSVQIGAFTVLKNAKIVKEKFEKSDLPVEIKEKKVNGKTFFAVWMGKFDDVKTARKYAQTFRDKYGIDAKIVKR